MMMGLAIVLITNCIAAGKPHCVMSGDNHVLDSHSRIGI